MVNVIMYFKTSAFSICFEDEDEWTMYHSGSNHKKWLTQTHWGKFKITKVREALQEISKE